MSLSKYIKSADFKSEKHVPVIEVGAKGADGVYEVTVSVGKEIAHPNTTEHFIEWIALYFKPANGQVYSLGKAVFAAHGASAEGANKGPAYTSPWAVFKVKIAGEGVLLAESYCNIHGVWESELAVK